MLQLQARTQLRRAGELHAYGCGEQKESMLAMQAVRWGVQSLGAAAVGTRRCCPPSPPACEGQWSHPEAYRWGILVLLKPGQGHATAAPHGSLLSLTTASLTQHLFSCAFHRQREHGAHWWRAFTIARSL